MKYLLPLLLVLLLVTPALAGQVYVSYGVGSFAGDDDNIGDPNVMHSGSLGYSFNKYLETAIEYSTVKLETIKDSSVRADYLLATLTGKLPLNKRLSLYGTGGIGQAWFKDKDMALVTVRNKCHKYAYPAETVNADDSIAWKGGVGVQYNVWKNLWVAGEQNIIIVIRGRTQAWTRGVGFFL